MPYDPHLYSDDPKSLVLAPKISLKIKCPTAYRLLHSNVLQHPHFTSFKQSSFANILFLPVQTGDSFVIFPMDSLLTCYLIFTYFLTLKTLEIQFHPSIFTSSALHAALNCQRTYNIL